MNYGKGKQASNLCVHCGRGGARSWSNAGRAHKDCIPDESSKAYPCKDRANCTYPRCDCGKKDNPCASH